MVAADALAPADVEAWAALEARAAEPNPYFSPTAVLPAAQLLRDGARVGVLRVEDEGEWLFAMPVVRRAGYRRLPVAALVSWQHDYCFLGTPLADRDRLREAWEEVLDVLRYRPEERWLVLERATVHGPVAVALHRAVEARRTRLRTVDLFGRPVLRRRPDNTYLQDRISARHLKNLRRQRRRLAEVLEGEVALTDHAALADGSGAAVEGLIAVEAAGWKGRAGTALASRPADAEYFRRLCAAMAERDALQVWTLGTRARPAAYQTNLLAGGTVFHFKIAYDEELASCSPGLQLEIAMVDEFHRDERLSQVDSCVDPDNQVSAQLYPDREALATLLVPVRGLGGVAATRAAGLLVDGVERSRPVRRRLGQALQRTPERST